MKRIVFASVTAVLVALSASLSACGWLVVERDAGPVVTKEFSLSDFNAIDAGSAFTLTVTKSDNFSVKVTARENVFKNLNVSKTGRTLKIGTQGLHVTFGSGRPLEAAITMPELVGLEISGATSSTVRGFDSKADMNTIVSGASSLDLDASTGAFSCRTSGSSRVTVALKSSSVKIEQSGASSAIVDIETEDFEYSSAGSSGAKGTVSATKTIVDLSGASDLQITGSGGNLKMTESGSSGARLDGFRVRDADLRLSGASNADVDIEGRLDLTLSGGSDLKYGGNPTFGQRMEVTGGSRVAHR